MNQFEVVLAGRDVSESEPTAGWRDLEPGVIEDECPGLHSAVEDAADFYGLAYATCAVEPDGVLAAAGHVDVEGRNFAGSLNVVGGLVGVREGDRIALADGDRFGLELEVLLIDDDGLRLASRVVRGFASEGDDGLGEFARFGLLDVVARVAPGAGWIGAIGDGTLNRAGGFRVSSRGVADGDEECGEGCCDGKEECQTH